MTCAVFLSVQEFMTFTSQLIVERSAKGSRASVKEQGKRTCRPVSMRWPGCPALGRSPREPCPVMERPAGPPPRLLCPPPPPPPLTQSSYCWCLRCLVKITPKAWTPSDEGAASGLLGMSPTPTPGVVDIADGAPRPAEVTLCSIRLRFGPRSLEAH